MYEDIEKYDKKEENIII